MTRIARIERAKERGEYTAPGTKPNAMNPTKVERKEAAKRNAMYPDALSNEKRADEEWRESWLFDGEETWEAMLCGR